MRDHDIGAVELAWSPPVNTGGLPIRGYKLEMREGRSFTWRTYPNEESTVVSLPDELANPSVVVSGIKPNKEYFFRVSAINSDGCGPPLTAADSYVKRVRLEAPKHVIAKPSPTKETGPLKIEITWTAPDIPTLNGFEVEMMDAEETTPQWIPMDFIPKMVTEKSGCTHAYRAMVPRPKGVYKFRVNAAYPEGKSDWVPTDFVLASEPSSQDRIPPPITEAKFIPTAQTPGGRIPATLRWETPDRGDVDSIRGYAIESWDTKRKAWKPVADVPREAPTELTFDLPPSQRATPMMRITTLGDVTKSVPVEVPLERARRIEQGALPRDWKPLPSLTEPVRWEPDTDEELSMLRTGAATPTVSDFILQRRQAALNMVRRTTTGTPRSAGIEYAPLERFFAETPLMDHRPGTRTPHPLESLKILERDKTTATLEWPAATDDLGGFTVERWRPGSGRWTRMAEIPPSQTRYDVPLTDIPREGESGTDVWLRVVPRDDAGKPSAPAFQLDKPLALPGGEYLPSSVWGVTTSPIGGFMTPGRPVNISWRPPSFTGGLPLTGYNLVIVNADTEEKRSVFVSPNTTSHRIEGLHPLHEYRVTITAVNRAGESLPVTSTLPKPPSPETQLRRPAPPTAIEFVPFGGGPLEGKSGVLSWRPGSRSGALPTESHVIEKWDSRSKQWVPFKKVGPDVHEITIPHLLDDLVYTFRVRAQNEAGMSEPGVAKEYYCPGAPAEESLFPTAMKAPPAPPLGPLSYETLTSQQRLDNATDEAVKVMELRWEEPIPNHEFTTPRAYVLEAKRRQQNKWAVIGRRPIPEGSRWPVAFGPPAVIPEIDLNLRGLPESMASRPALSWLSGEPRDYEYRLSSENEYGLSQPIYLRPTAMTPLSRPYSPLLRPTRTEPLTTSPITTVIEPPRGPLSISRVPPRPLNRRAEVPDTGRPRTPTSVVISWKPPMMAQDIRGYDIAYREPFRSTWTHLGTVDVYPTSFTIPKSMLHGLPETLHIGVASIGGDRTTTPYLSPRLEDTILLPNPREEDLYSGRDIVTPVSKANVGMRLIERHTTQTSSPSELELSWVFPETKRAPQQRPEGYIAFYRELGSQQWQELERFPLAKPRDSTVLRDLPRDVTMFVGIAPITSRRIGSIVSTPDTVRIPGFTIPTPSSLFDRIPLQVRPTSPGGVDVSWTPPAKIDQLMALTPGKVPVYELQVRRPGEITWRPAGRPTSLESGVLPDRTVTFGLHELHAGDRLDFRLLAYPDLGKKPIQVSDELPYKFVPPYGKFASKCPVHSLWCEFMQ